MNDYNRLLEQIPIHYNLLALVVFAIILFGVLIFSIILQKNKSQNQAIYFLGFGILTLTLVLFDFFICYTGLMKYVPWLNNSTEIFVLFIPVCFYLFVINFLQMQKVSFQKYWWVLVIPIGYFICQLGIHFQSNALKLNNYISGFHPHLTPIPLKEPTSIWYQIATYMNNRVHQLMIFSFVFYLAIGIKIMRDHNLKIKTQFPTPRPSKKLQKYRFSVYVITLSILTTVVAIIVFAIYTTDLGEQYIMFFPMLAIFIVGYSMMSTSHFFDKSWLLEKYHAAHLNVSASDILQKIVTYVQEEEYYLKKDGSLNDLATQLSLSPTYLSQIINKEAGKNFNDFINYYRIEEVKKRLLDEAYSHLNMAGIGDTVGFKSRSSFYAVFKKHTQLTPAAYAKAMKIEKSHRW